ncbi:MAG: efflux RND transporter periplasmic adaptor subunit [Pseudolabrys sp.]
MDGSRERSAKDRLRSAALLVGVIAVVAGTGWGLVWSRGKAIDKGDDDRPIESASRVTVEDGLTVIKVAPAAQKHNGIVTTRLSPAPFRRQIRAYGTVLDLSTLTDLSNKYANATSQLQTAEAKLSASKSAFERAQHLYHSQHVVSLAQFQTAESAFRVDTAAVAAAQSQVRTLTATAYQEWGTALGKSLVEETPLVKHLIERDDYLLQVTLPPGVTMKEAPLTARVELGRHPDIAITFISPATRTDPKIQGISYFYKAPASSGLLPGMNVLAFLPSDTTVDGIKVPADAVVWWQDRAWIYRRTKPDSFMRMSISTDLPAPGGGYVVAGLSGPADIVTRGPQLLLSEEFRSQAKPDED